MFSIQRTRGQDKDREKDKLCLLSGPIDRRAATKEDFQLSESQEIVIRVRDPCAFEPQICYEAQSRLS
jgi:hypothetical protein